jgi:hypothetical protein
MNEINWERIELLKLTAAGVVATFLAAIVLVAVAGSSPSDGYPWNRDRWLVLALSLAFAAGVIACDVVVGRRWLSRRRTRRTTTR